MDSWFKLVSGFLTVLINRVTCLQLNACGLVFSILYKCVSRFYIFGFGLVFI